MSHEAACSKGCAFRKGEKLQKDTLLIPLSPPVLGDSAKLLKWHMDRHSQRQKKVDEGSSVDPPNYPNHSCRPKSSSPSMCSTSTKLYNSPKRPPLKPPDGVFGKSTPNRVRSASATGTMRFGSPISRRCLDKAEKQGATPDNTNKNYPSRLSSRRNISASPQRTSTPLLISGSRTSIHSQSKQEQTPVRCLSASRDTPIKYKSDDTEDDDEDILRLNFSYKINCKPHKTDDNANDKKSDVHQCVSSSSTSSMEDTAELVYKFRRRMKKMKENLDFTKYIPIPIPVPLLVPKLFLNQMDPEEWNEAQEAYQRDRVENIKESGSDTRIDDTKDQVVPGTPNKVVKCIPLKCSSGGKNKKTSSKQVGKDQEFQPLEEFYFNYLKPRHNIPRRMDSRYDLDKAQLLIQSNIKNNPNYSCILYIALPQTPNFPLCHAMTELCVAAMLNFFHPYRDVQCLWIEDMQGKLINLLNDHSLKPRFTRLVYLRKFEAILILSEEASHLLRHKDMCFLHSITSSLKIAPHKLLILCREGGNAGQALTRPNTAQY